VVDEITESQWAALDGADAITFGAATQTDTDVSADLLHGPATAF
jgi:hypothetical protein